MGGRGAFRRILNARLLVSDYRIENMFERPANRIYRNSELGLWLRRVSCDWEKFFRPPELAYGRKLYKSGAVRTLELNSSEAIICAKLSDDSEPYCVLDFDGDAYQRRRSSAGLLNAALAVAGFYEIEELVGDVFSSDEFLDYDETEAIARAKNEALAGEIDAGAAPQEGALPRLDAEDSRQSPGNSEYPRLELEFSSRRKGLAFSASWRFEDGKKHKAFGEKCLPISELGDSQKENLVRLATMSRKYGFKYLSGAYMFSELSKIPSFIQSVLPIWEKYFTIKKDANVDLLALGERNVELRPVARNVDSNQSDFDIEWESSVDGKVIAPSEFSKLVGNGISALRIVPDYGILRVSSDDTAFVRGVERAREFGFESGKIPRYMLLSVSEFGGEMRMSPALKEWMDSLLSECDSFSYPLPGFLRNYQKRGVRWAKRLFDHDCNALIADEMGLGKTLQALTLISMSASDKSKKFFVACPASVIPVWASESGKFFPGLKIGVLSSSSDFDGAQVWISSYTQLRRNRAAVEKVLFEIAVLDEAQFIKNPDAKTTAACMALKAKRKIALTGTPVENRLLDMWTTFRWLMPGLMGQRAAFESALQSDESFVRNMRRQIAPFVLRRLKSEVAAELPEKIYVDLVCPMSEQQKSEYGKLLAQARETLGGAAVKDAKARFTVLSLLTRLRQAACDAALLPWIGRERADTGGKISVLADKVEELFQSRKKILIFSQFTRFLDLISENLSARIPSAPIYTLTGATRDRAKPVSEFQNAAGGAIMLVSLRAGGTGITLTSADYVFLADPWWNPSVEEQAIDRVHRIGRRGDVFVYRMIAQDTVEDRVRSLQTQKRRLFNDLLGGLKDVSNHFKFVETVSDILS